MKTYWIDKITIETIAKLAYARSYLVEHDRLFAAIFVGRDIKYKFPQLVTNTYLS